MPTASGRPASPAIQINTGKGCHLDADMVRTALARLGTPANGILFIENVGNLVCPAGFDLGEAHKVVIVSVTEGEDKPLKYSGMFAAADLMVVTKTDLLPHLDFDVDRLIDNARRVNPTIGVLKLSAKSGEGMDRWMHWLASARVRFASPRTRRLRMNAHGRAHFDTGHGAAAVDPRRLRLRVRGLVQGVGFRPHVWRLAMRAELTGFALNDQDGVLIEVQGDVDAFVDDLVAEAPPLARIDGVESELCPLVPGESDFVIRASEQSGSARTAITPDVAICEACLAELFDPANRRYLYPFITCTHCGPRFTVTRHLPYDRATTSLTAFPLCEACAAEYADPADRRFHAETTCCPTCGPQLDIRLKRSAPASAPVRSWRSRDSAVSISSVTHATKMPSSGCARVSAATASRSL